MVNRDELVPSRLLRPQRLGLQVLHLADALARDDGASLRVVDLELQPDRELDEFQDTLTKMPSLRAPAAAETSSSALLVAP